MNNTAGVQVIIHFKYAGPFRYRVELGDAFIESSEAAGGRIWCYDENDPDTPAPENRYFITDHLGSTRVVLKGDGTLSMKADYLPYGGLISGSGLNVTENDYLWTGKELQHPLFDTPAYDSSARLLFTNGLFASLDPLAEKYPGVSPYVYCKGNPIRRVDPDGMTDWDKVVGFLIGTVTNIIPGTGFARDLYQPEDKSDYNQGLKTSDDVSEIVGKAMVVAGGTLDATGGATAATGALVCASGVGAPAGTVAVVGGVAEITTGQTLVLGGSIMLANTADNASAGYQRGQDKSTGDGRKNGETNYTKRGKEEHKNYNPGDGYILNSALPSGKRPDAYNPSTGVIRELKPNNQKAINRGYKQLEGYKQELQRLYPDVNWKLYIDTY